MDWFNQRPAIFFSLCLWWEKGRNDYLLFHKIKFKTLPCKMVVSGLSFLLRPARRTEWQKKGSPELYAISALMLNWHEKSFAI